MSRGSKRFLKNKEKKMAAKKSEKEKEKRPNQYRTEPDGFEANISFPRKKQ